MAIKQYTFSGVIEYPHLAAPNKYEKFSLDFFPKDNEDRKAIKATGTKCSLKERDNKESSQHGNFFFTFTSPDNPALVGVPDGVLVGNGSEATVKLTVEDFMSAKWGKVVRTKLSEVRVTKLVAYEPKAKELPV
jgi:hypothetical protein